MAQPTESNFMKELNIKTEFIKKLIQTKTEIYVFWCKNILLEELTLIFSPLSSLQYSLVLGKSHKWLRNVLRSLPETVIWKWFKHIKYGLGIWSIDTMN